LAQRGGIDERYAREWLEQQAVAGILDIADGSEDPAKRGYTLPAGHAEALLDPESPGYAAAIPPGLLGLATALDTVATAYRTGDGVAYERYGAEIREHIGGFNRPMFANDLAAEWLPALPDVHTRLVGGEPVRVLDIACGTGWSAISLARAYPNVSVTGINIDTASIESGGCSPCSWSGWHRRLGRPARRRAVGRAAAGGPDERGT
jgi:hypothetical protein